VLLILALVLATFLYLRTETLIAQEKDEPLIVLPEVKVEEAKETTYYGEEDATTATKTETPIEEIPQSIETINRDVIDDQGAVRLQDTVYNVSGTVPGDSFLVPFLLRGFRAEVLKDGFIQNTALPLNIFQQELTNVERIEFLKGPGSVLYGNVAPGGLINIITKKPLPYFYASAQMTVGNYSFYQPSVDVSVPLNKDKTLLFRLNASYLNTDSFRDFISQEWFFIGPVVSWRILPNMTFTLEGEYFQIDQPFDEGLVAVGNMVAPIPISRNLAEPTDHTSFQNILLKATLETKFSDRAFLRNAFRYYRTSADNFDHRSLALLEDNRTLLRFIFDSTFEENIYDTQNEFILNIKTWSFKHKLLFGFEYIRMSIENPSRFLPATPIDIFDPVYGTKVPATAPLLNRIGELNSFGFYMQDQITVLNNLFLLFGVRFDVFDQNLEEIGVNPIGDITTDKMDSQVSPRFGIVYEPFRGVSFYANYSMSFNRLLGQAITFNGSILEPQSSTQYEGGIKLDLWGGRLSSTAAFYRITTENALAPDPVNGGIFAVQVGEERSQGFELDLTAAPLPGWNIIASFAYTDAKVADDEIFKEGNELPGVPKYSGSFWTTYKLYKGILRGLGAGIGLIAVGERQGDIENTFTLDPFLRLDAALYYDTQIRNFAKVKASINFNNITDTEYFANSTSRVNIIPGAPFTVLGTLRVDF